MVDDTRDRLIALEVEVKHLVGLVEKSAAFSRICTRRTSRLRAAGGPASS